jgi:H+-translocating NAD(P) transhydrogenase subunit alpha
LPLRPSRGWRVVRGSDGASPYHGAPPYRCVHMISETLIATFYVFILAAFLGYQVISRVPPLLHTPLMSATNAISGISLVGSLVTAGAHHTTVSAVLGFVAVVCSTTNVVGGFVLTDRMLGMFKRKTTPPEKKKE